MASILLIDDDPHLTEFVRDDLTGQGYHVDCLDSAERGLDVLAGGAFDLVLLDNQLPRISGLDFLKALHARHVELPVILITGQGRADTAIQATRFGAFDYVVKPMDYQVLCDALQPLIRKALAIDRSGRQRVRLPGEAAPEAAPEQLLLGNSRPMQEVYKLIGEVAGGNVPVLIHGETGTGKDLIARAIHTHSDRRDRRFLAISCPALNEHLEEELFGHEPGAFPGADKLRKGRFEHAEGGTLFLDAAADMPASLQVKLLRFLENGEVCRLGSNEPLKVNVRLLSATSRDLKEAIREGKFRADLFYRLNGVTIHLPTLKERGPEDLRLLAEHFLTRAAEDLGRPVPTLDASAWERLQGYSWPGNVRQLRSCMLRAVLVCRGSVVLPADLDLEDGATATANGESGAAALRQVVRWAWAAHRTNVYPLLHDLLRRELLEHALSELQGNEDEAARCLGIAVEGLRAWLQQLQPATGHALQGRDGSAALDKGDKKNLRRARAMTLIPAHPEWTVEHLARELGCSPATLWRDPIISRLLKGRAGGKDVPRGFATSSGDLEAYE